MKGKKGEGVGTHSFSLKEQSRGGGEKGFIRGGEWGKGTGRKRWGWQEGNQLRKPGGWDKLYLWKGGVRDVQNKGLISSYVERGRSIKGGDGGVGSGIHKFYWGGKGW